MLPDTKPQVVGHSGVQQSPLSVGCDIGIIKSHTSMNQKEDNPYRLTANKFVGK